MEAVGDDGVDIQPGLDHDGHLVPCFIHFTPVDPLDGQAVEDHIVPVDGSARRQDP